MAGWHLSGQARQARIHPGGSGLDPRGVLDRLLGHVS
jgi:hypothetical protein